MKKIYAFFCLCTLLLCVPSAMGQLTSMSREGGMTELQNDVSRASGWLTWFDVNTATVNGINVSSPMSLAVAQRFTPSDLAPYDGYTLTQVQFYLWQPSGEPATTGTYTVKVYQGGSYTSGTAMSPGVEVASQTVSSLTMDSWNTVTLSSPVTIDASQELWFGVYINNGTGIVMSYDDASNVVGKGALIYDVDDAAWYDVNDYPYIDFQIYNWGMRAYALDNSGVTVDLGTFFIDNGTNQNRITSLTVPYGSSFSPVTVAYNYNYGAATNNFTGVITYNLTFDGTFIGTYATGSTTIATGAGVYFDDITIFTPAYIESHNYYGTHSFCMEATVPSPYVEADATDNTGCLTVTFEGPTVSTDHTISVQNTDNSVFPSGNVVVTDGSSATFTITVPDCSSLGDVLVDGVSVIGQVVNTSANTYTYTFNSVTGDHTLQVVYVSGSYTITSSTDGHGTITPASVSVNCGEQCVLTITPQTGYHLLYVTDNTMDVTASVSNQIYTITNISQNHVVYAAFEQDDPDLQTFTINISGTGITPNGTITVTEGDSQTFTITESDCQTLTDLLLDGASVMADVQPQGDHEYEYTLVNITANHTLQPVFVTDTYTVTSSTDGHGTVTPASSTVNCGDQCTLTITPQTGYHLLYVTDNTMDVTTSVVNQVYTISNVSQNHVVYAAFEQDNSDLQTFTIDISGTGISPNGTITVTEGDSQTFTITEPDCQTLSDLLLDGVSVMGSVQSLGNNTYEYTLSNITANHTLEPVYVMVTYSITASTDGHGTIIPDQLEANCGEDLTFAITPNAGYRLLALIDNAEDVTSLVVGDSYTMENVRAAHFIYVTFVLENGIQESENHGVRLFPNPAAEQLSISTDIPMQQVEVMDVTGKCIGNYDASGNQMVLNVSALSSGMYMVRIVTGTDVVVKKFLKK